MTAIRHILVPSDFSEPSRAALEYAADLGRAFDASVDVLHVWEAPTFIPLASLLETGVADLVIGTHGRTGLSHALIGSVAERVVRHASCPVLAVRGQ
jgi:universal stress protein A